MTFILIVRFLIGLDLPPNFMTLFFRKPCCYAYLSYQSIFSNLDPRKRRRLLFLISSKSNMSSASETMSSLSTAPTYTEAGEPFSQPQLDDTPLSDHITEAQSPKDGRTYWVNHTTKTTSWIHPLRNIYTEGLPWPWERRFDVKGRAYYMNHETETTSWLNPVLREKFEKEGKLEGEIYEDVEGADCVVKEKARDGEVYWVNYTQGTLGGPGDLGVVSLALE